MVAAGELFSIQVVVGRVLEARVFRLPDVTDADEYSRALAAEVSKFPATVQPILCADHRPVAIYSQPVADRLTELFTQMNKRLERVAILVARSNATLSLQLSRIVREAGYDQRRVFWDAPDAVTFLSSALDPDEVERVGVFLNEFRPSG